MTYQLGHGKLGVAKLTLMVLPDAGLDVGREEVAGWTGLCVATDAILEAVFDLAYFSDRLNHANGGTIWSRATIEV